MRHFPLPFEGYILLSWRFFRIHRAREKHLFFQYVCLNFYFVVNHFILTQIYNKFVVNKILIINLFEANHHLFRLYIACKCNVLTHCAPLRLMILSPHTKFPVFRPQIISYHSHRNIKITPNAELPIVIHIREWNVQVLVEFEQGIPKLRLCGCPQLSFRLKHWRKHFPVLACILTIFRHKKKRATFS